MKRAFLLAALAAGPLGCILLALAVLLAPSPASAAVSGFRGIVVDEQGKPVPDVDVEIQFLGSPKRTYHVKTNKQGGFVRIGVDEGSYKIFLTKEGYKKGGLDVPWLSLGGLSDLCSNNPGKDQPCEPLILKKAEVAIAIGGAPAAPAADVRPAQGGQPGAQPGSGAATATPEEAAKLGAAYAQAIEAIKVGQWDTAELALKEVLAKVPDQPVVHFNLGHIYRQKKDYPAAEAEFRKVMALEPAKPDAFVALAALYETQGKGAEAVEVLQKNAAAFVQDAKYQVALGATAMNQGQEKEAEAAFSKAVELDPSNVEIQYFLASLALNRNEVADAIGHLEKYLSSAPATSPNVPVAKELLAALQAQQAKVKK